MRGGVNDNTLWGMPRRTIRLNDITWERNIFGTCGKYYRITYIFEVNYDTWNRFILDEGTRVKILKDFPVSDINPLVPYVDPYTGKPGRALLNGQGYPIDSVYGNMSEVFVHEKEIEQEFDFFLLGIPASF
jgi:hypothetical protein